VELFACGVSSPGTLWSSQIALDHFKEAVSEGLFLLPSSELILGEGGVVKDLLPLSSGP